ncbi:tRNA dimethylallyltransferase [Methyloceanibacter methanicus]|uniref:tRNA dimethylallyltransferase n=1 Tax=Methyloceanibacter methanicus TaxID=1774968 RepID=A0A1E3W0U9_9HYPH|nr:tRNA (adenosine(37)-N6)-dimethylallyltransferase MiaA [Methyloceanibacter methanicus]ODR98756.1 tRNA dimethylallyltransferase [Methyloceanibacter methanicus]
MFEAVLIAGPTASGKSAAALALAERLGGTIVNADSMQVYRELQVLTARPSAAEMEIVPHRLYGTVSGREAYSVGRWVEDAAAAIEETRKRGQVPIFVGGTGLYFMALLQGLSPVPDIPEDIRRHWRERAATTSGSDLHAALSARDPVMAARLGPTDTQRLVRALEVIDATDVSLADWQETTGTPLLKDEAVLKILVAPEREAVYAAIDARFDAMLREGALAEAESLAALDLDPGLPVMRALGVPELLSHLSGAISLEDAATKAKTASRRYAKRQMTWARRFMADWTQVPSGEAAAAAIGERS